MPQIHAIHPTSGFLIVFDDVDRHMLDEAIAWLQQRGYQPATSGDQWRRTPTGEPLCSRHGVVMTKREKQGDIWYSHQVIHPQTGEELYCRGYSNPTSKTDGYDV